jgi:hypothetical protein
MHPDSLTGNFIKDSKSSTGLFTSLQQLQLLSPSWKTCDSSDEDALPIETTGHNSREHQGDTNMNRLYYIFRQSLYRSHSEYSEPLSGEVEGNAESFLRVVRFRIGPMGKG